MTAAAIRHVDPQGHDAGARHLTRVGVLAHLRTPRPTAPLTERQTRASAEDQANRLRELHGLQGPLAPDTVVTGLPGIRVVTEPDVPGSGSAHWANGYWLIVLNANEPIERRRLSALHELKHILDHRDRARLYPGPAPDSTNEALAEDVADFFAGAVLMPRVWVERLREADHWSVESLAETFQVSTRAMEVRLEQLGWHSRSSEGQGVDDTRGAAA